MGPLASLKSLEKPRMVDAIRIPFDHLLFNLGTLELEITRGVLIGLYTLANWHFIDISKYTYSPVFFLGARTRSCPVNQSDRPLGITFQALAVGGC